MIRQQDPEKRERARNWLLLVCVVGGVIVFIVGSNADLIILEGFGLLLVLFAMWQLGWMLYRTGREIAHLKSAPRDEQTGESDGDREDERGA